MTLIELDTEISLPNCKDDLGSYFNSAFEADYKDENGNQFRITGTIDADFESEYYDVEDYTSYFIERIIFSNIKAFSYDYDYTEVTFSKEELQSMLNEVENRIENEFYG